MYKNILILIITIATLLTSCNNQPPIKKELEQVFKIYTSGHGITQIDVLNSSIHDGSKHEIHALVNYSLEDTGVKLEITQDYKSEGSRLEINGDNTHAFITYTSIKSVYVQEDWRGTMNRIVITLHD